MKKFGCLYLIWLITYFYSFSQTFEFEPRNGQLSISSPSAGETVVLDGNGGLFRSSFGSLYLTNDYKIGAGLLADEIGGSLYLYDLNPNEIQASITADGDSETGIGKDYGQIILRTLYDNPFRSFKQKIELYNRSHDHDWKLGYEFGLVEEHYQDKLVIRYNDIDVVHIVNGEYFQISDARFKRNIMNLSTSLVSLLNIKPVSYHIMDQNRSNRKQIGLIAQNVLKWFPHLVTELIEGNEVQLKVNYTGMIPILIKAIQEQQEFINQQQAQLDYLLNQIRLLEKVTP